MTYIDSIDKIAQAALGAFRRGRTGSRINTKPFYAFFALAMMHSVSALAQGSQLKLWALPPNQMSFNPNPVLPLNPLPYGYTGQESLNTYNSMHDKNGDLLFFIVDGAVYDKDGTFVDFIMNPSNNQVLRGITEWLIVPVPSQCDKYYLIAADYTNSLVHGNPSTFYTILDLTGSIPNLTSTVASNTIPFSTDVHNGAMHLAATTRLVSGDRFLFISDSWKIYRFKITSSGIFYDNDVISIPGATNSGAAKNEMEIVKLDNGNYRIAVGFDTESTGEKIFVGNLDPSGVLIGSPTIIDVDTPVGSPEEAIIKGLEFSADGRYLYVSHTVAPYLQYVDLQTSTALTPLPHPSSFHPEDFQLSQIELGYDGRMYFAGNNAAGTYPRLATLDTPDTPASPTWTDNRVPNVNLPPNWSNYSLYGPTPSFVGSRILPDQIDGENYTPVPSLSIIGPGPLCGSDNLGWIIYEIRPFNPGLQYNIVVNGGNLYGNSGQLFDVTWTNPTGGTITIEVSDPITCGKAKVIYSQEILDTNPHWDYTLSWIQGTWYTKYNVTATPEVLGGPGTQIGYSWSIDKINPATGLSVGIVNNPQSWQVEPSSLNNAFKGYRGDVTPPYNDSNSTAAGIFDQNYIYHIKRTVWGVSPWNCPSREKTWILMPPRKPIIIKAK